MFSIKKAILTAVLVTGAAGSASAQSSPFAPPSPFGVPASPFAPTSPSLPPFSPVRTAVPVSASISDADLQAMLKELGYSSEIIQIGSDSVVKFVVNHAGNTWMVGLKRTPNDGLVHVYLGFNAYNHAAKKAMTPEQMDPRVLVKIMKIFSDKGVLTQSDAPTYIAYDGGSSLSLVTPIGMGSLTSAKLKSVLDRQLQYTQQRLLPLLTELESGAQGSASALR